MCPVAIDLISFTEFQELKCKPVLPLALWKSAVEHQPRTEVVWEGKELVVSLQRIKDLFVVVLVLVDLTK